MDYASVKNIDRLLSLKKDIEALLEIHEDLLEVELGKMYELDCNSVEYTKTYDKLGSTMPRYHNDYHMF